METYLIFVDAIRNNNKFWSAKVEGTELTVEWGRVGYTPQKKVQTLPNTQAATSKYHSLIAEKKAKGYQESQPQVSDRPISEIRRAINLLNVIRPYVAARNFNENYMTALNEYLKIIPTPLGMQIEPCKIYQTVDDVDRQKESLNNLLSPSSIPFSQTAEVTKSQVETVSLKSLSKGFWKHF